MNWRSYTWGYKRAGDLLAEHGIAHGGQHVLVYPTVFLYRQYIELLLKEIIRNGRLCLGFYQGFPPGFPTHHRIDELWSECRSILERIDEEEWEKLGEDERRKYLTELDAVEQGIGDFSKWDPDSTAFRYPLDKEGNPSLSDLKSINFRDLSRLVERIDDLLEAISVGISEYLNAKHESEAR